MPSLKLKVLTPKHMPTGAEYLKAAEKAAQQTAGLVLQDFRSTTRTWKHKPKFDITITNQGGDYTIGAGTDDPIYMWVSEGTKPHTIRAKRSPYLIFQGGYRAKTRVGIIGSNEGGRDPNGEWFRKKQVKHPGFKGRRFIKLIQSRRQKTLEQRMRQEFALVERTQK